MLIFVRVLNMMKKKHVEVCSWSADYPYNALTPRITDSDKNIHWTSTSFDYLL